MTATRRLGNLYNRMYALGIVSGVRHSWGGGEGYRVRAYWRGRRPYVLGLQREWWGCLIKRGHIPKPEERYGRWCGRCMPCPDCGETRFDHTCGGTR